MVKKMTEKNNKKRNIGDFKKLTEEEIKELANDIYKGLVFTDRQLNNPDDLCRVFMPLIFLKEKDIEDLKKNPPGMIYEYMGEASPRCINGMPMFLSVRMISQEDTKKVLEKYSKIVEAVNSA